MPQDGSWLRAKRRSLLGEGPHNCFFCQEPIEERFDVHHIDGDHKNDTAPNLSAAHSTCHRSFHKSGNQNRLGHKHSQETRRKMSASAMGNQNRRKKVA
jgi:hypothetical protein